MYSGDYLGLKSTFKKSGGNFFNVINYKLQGREAYLN